MNENSRKAKRNVNNVFLGVREDCMWMNAPNAAYHCENEVTLLNAIHKNLYGALLCDDDAELASRLRSACAGFDKITRLIEVYWKDANKYRAYREQLHEALDLIK